MYLVRLVVLSGRLGIVCGVRLVGWLELGMVNVLVALVAAVVDCGLMLACGICGWCDWTGGMCCWLEIYLC